MTNITFPFDQSGTQGDEPHRACTDVLIHVNDALDSASAKRLMQQLNSVKGVSGTRFRPEKNHLVMVCYDPQAVRATNLLHTVLNHGHQAQLVGL